MECLDIKTFTAISQALITAIAAAIAFFSFKISKQNLTKTHISTQLKLYELVEKHHSKETTILRSTVFQLEDNVAKARATGKTLQESNPQFHADISALVNYYESLGMFLQYSWPDLHEQARDMMLDMVHNSVSKIWPLIDKHKDAIYPSGRPRDWAQSFQWLHVESQKYRTLNQLT